MGFRVTSNRIRQVDRLVKARAHRGMEAGAAAVADHARFLVSVQGPPPSAPGDPPHVDSGELIAGIFWDYDPATFTAVVGTTSPHGYYTEFGPLYAPRPWLRPAFLDTATTVAWAIARAF